MVIESILWLDRIYMLKNVGWLVNDDTQNIN